MVDEYIGSTFEKWPFEGELLADKVFEKCIFEKINLIGFKFASCKFDECTFINCVFSAVEFSNCRLNDIKIESSKMVGIDWTKTKEIVRVRIKNSVLDMSNFGFLKLAKSKIVGCSLRECDFTETDLAKADLSGNDFDKSRFFKTDLSGANLTGSKNYAINVFGNKLVKTKFSMPEVIDLLKGLDIVIE